MNAQGPQNFTVGDNVSLSATVTRLPQTPAGQMVTVELAGVAKKDMLSPNVFQSPPKVGDKVPVHGIVTAIDGEGDRTQVTIGLHGWKELVTVPLALVQPDP